MIRSFKHIILMALAIAVVLGCEKTEPSLADGYGVEIELLLKAGKLSKSDLQYDRSNLGRECCIDVDNQDIQIYAFYLDGTFAGRAENLVVTPDPDQVNNYDLYHAKGIFSNLPQQAGSYKVVVVANYKGGATGKILPIGLNLAPSTEVDLYNGANFNFRMEGNGQYFDPLTNLHLFTSECYTPAMRNEAPDWQTYNCNIPMWGSRTVVLVNKGTYRIDMLRSLAKASVALSDEIKDTYEITECTIVDSRMSASLAPKNAQTLRDTPLVSELQHQNLVGQKYGEITGAAAPGYKFFAKNGVHHCYFPEQGKGESYIRVSIRNKLSGITRDYKLQFGDYETRTLWPVLRNHYYEYNIIRVGAEIKYEVCDWVVKVAPDIIFE